jgi:hypothetical protein
MRRRRQFGGAILGVAALALLLGGAGRAGAGFLEILVTESGGPTIPITDNGGLDTDPTTGVIKVNTTLLNLSLVNYQFTALSATSTSPGTGGTGSLTLSGSVQLIFGGTGSITILASDGDYAQPGTPPATLGSSSKAVYSNGNQGDTQTFQSWFNPTNTAGAKEIPSPLLTLTSTGPAPNTQLGTAPPTPVTLVTPYGLTDQAVITLSGGGGDAQSQDDFEGVTQLAAASVAAVPEPASVTLLATGALGLLGYAWRRRMAATA